MPEKVCLVCGATTALCSKSSACEPCKKFFARSRNKFGELVCSSGRGDCFSKFQQHVNVVTRRQYCVRCRLAKCFEIGMESSVANRQKNKKQTTPSAAAVIGASAGGGGFSGANQAAGVPVFIDDSSGSSSSFEYVNLVNDNNNSHQQYQQPIIITNDYNVDCYESNANAPFFTGQVETQRHQLSQAIVPAASRQMPPNNNFRQPIITFLPPNGQGSIAENTLKVALTAVAELSKLQSLPWGNTEFPNDCSLWHHAMGVFNEITETVSGYLKAVQVLGKISLKDRCRLFTRSHSCLFAVEVTQPGSQREFHFFGMNAKYRRQILKAFPVYLTLVDEFEEIAAVMNAWQPSFVEFALLQAMILFRSDDSQLDCPEAIEEVKRKLQFTLDWYWSKQENLELRKHYFYRAYSYLIQRFEENYGKVISSLSNYRPDLTGISQIFVDLYVTAPARSSPSPSPSSTPSPSPVPSPPDSHSISDPSNAEQSMRLFPPTSPPFAFSAVSNENMSYNGGFRCQQQVQQMTQQQQQQQKQQQQWSTGMRPTMINQHRPIAQFPPPYHYDPFSL